MCPFRPCPRATATFALLGFTACGQAGEPDGEPATSAAAHAPAPEAFPPPSAILAQGYGGNWLNIDFVAQADPLTEAQRCVESRPGAVACFAFPSRADYEAAQPEVAGNFKGELCWTARWQRNGNGELSGQGERPFGGDCPTPTPARDAPVASPPPAGAAGRPLQVRLDFDVERDASGRARIVGTSNLPDGTAGSASEANVFLLEGIRWVSPSPSEMLDRFR
jgi:hypothetical protein